MHIIKYVPDLTVGNIRERFTFWGRPCALTRSPGPGRTGHPAAWPSPGFGVALVAACYANSDRSTGPRRCNGPLWGQCSAGPGCLSLPHGKNVRAVRPRHGGASLAAPGLDTPTPARCLNKSGTAWGWGGLRPPSLLAKTKDSVAGFCCAEKQTKKVGRETVRPGSPPLLQQPPKSKGLRRAMPALQARCARP